MRRLRFVMLLMAACLVVTTAATTAGALDDGDLNPALLSPDNIPDDGWEIAPPDVIESQPNTQANDVSGGWCGGATDGYHAAQLGATGNATVSLQKIVSQGEPYWFVWEALYAFADTADAKSFVRSTKVEGFGLCPDGWTVGGEIPNQVTAKVISWPKVGKQRLAVEVTTAGDGVTATTHVIYVRISNKVLSVHSRILPADEALLKKIVKKATKLLKKV